IRGGKRFAEEVAVDAGHDAEQGGLARTVGSEHADLRPVEEREPDAPENLPLGRDDLPEIFHDERVFAGHVSGFLLYLAAHPGRRSPGPATACGAHDHIQKRPSAGGAPAPRRPAARTTTSRAAPAISAVDARASCSGPGPRGSRPAPAS